MFFSYFAEELQVISSFKIRVGPFQKFPFFMTVEHGDFSVDTFLKRNTVSEVFSRGKHEVRAAYKAGVDIDVSF